MAKSAIVTIVIDSDTQIEFTGFERFQFRESKYNQNVIIKSGTDAYSQISSYLDKGYEIESVCQTPFIVKQPFFSKEAKSKIAITVVLKKEE